MYLIVVPQPQNAASIPGARAEARESAWYSKFNSSQAENKLNHANIHRSYRALQFFPNPQNFIAQEIAIRPKFACSHEEMRRDVLAGFSKTEIVSVVFQVAPGPGILRTPLSQLPVFSGASSKFPPSPAG